MNPLVSIIVPVYNAEKYIDKCIDSILLQTLTNFELLLVDDGSTDHSPEICDEYAAGDKRIKVFHKENTGVSDTRNKALDIAKGEYLIFLDADDYWCMDTVLEHLMQIAQANDLDIVRGEYKAVDEKGQDLFYRPVLNEQNLYSYKTLDSYHFIKYAIHGEFFLPLSLFKSSAIGSLRFATNRIFLEDMLFYVSLLQKKRRCMYVPNLRFYAYRKNSNSVSASINPQKMSDSFAMCEIFHELSTKVDDLNLKMFYREYSIKMYYYTLETLALNEYYEERFKYVDELDLNRRRIRITHWMSDYKMRFYSPVYYVNPICGINLFRFRHRLAKVKLLITKIICVK